MAHRTQYSKDIYLPRDIQQYRVVLQKQIQKVRKRQKLLVQQNSQKLMVLQRRLIYGKKKIFTFDKQINRMTLGDQISHYNMQIGRLNNEISNEQKAIKMRNEESKQRPQQYLVKETVLEVTGMRREAMELLGLGGNLLMSRNKQIIRHKQMSIVKQMSKSRQSEPTLITDPQQQLMSLTHQIIRLKKSLQQVRSKYSDNFTQYKLKQQYQKLKQQNQQIAIQLKQLQMSKKIVNEAISASNMSDVNYDQLEVIRAKKEYQIIGRERNLLGEYLERLEREDEERMDNDQNKGREFRDGRIKRKQQEIDQVTKHNQILVGEIKLVDKDILRCYNYQLKLKGRLSTN